MISFTPSLGSPIFASTSISLCIFSNDSSLSRACSSSSIMRQVIAFIGTLLPQMYKNNCLCSGGRAVIVMEVLNGIGNLRFGKIEIKSEYLIKDFHTAPRAELRILFCFFAPDAIVFTVNDASFRAFPDTDFQLPARLQMPQSVLDSI